MLKLFSLIKNERSTSINFVDARSEYTDSVQQENIYSPLFISKLSVSNLVASNLNTVQASFSIKFCVTGNSRINHLRSFDKNCSL